MPSFQWEPVRYEIVFSPHFRVVVALLAINRESGRCWLLGYSPDDSGWVVVDEWAYADIEHDSFYERLDEWEAETFAGRDGWMVG